MLLPLTGAGGKAHVATGGGGYTGYVDSFASPLGCWGFTACSAAIGAANTSAVQWNCTNGGAQSGTLHVTSTGGLNASDISSMNTVCGAQPITVQLTNQMNPGTADMTNGTSATRPVYTASAVNSLPCATFDGATTFLGASLTTLTAQPYTISVVAMRTGNTSAENDIFDSYNAAGTTFGFLNSTNTVFMYAGSVQSTTASDSNPHSIQAVFNGASSALDVDTGTANTVNAGSNSPDNTTVSLGAFVNGGTQNNFLTGKICRIAVWGSAANGTQLSNLHGNDVTTYGTP